MNIEGEEMRRLTNKERVIVTGLILCIVLVLDYVRVACCSIPEGCIKCESYFEHYFG